MKNEKRFNERRKVMIVGKKVVSKSYVELKAFEKSIRNCPHVKKIRQSRLNSFLCH